MFRSFSRLSWIVKRSMSSIGKGCLAELKSVEEFTTLLSSTEPVLVDFSAAWCGPCKVLSPVLQEVAVKNPQLHFIKVDVDKYPSLATQYNVSSVPFVVMFKNGKPVDSFMGALNAKMVQQFLDKNMRVE